MKPSFLNQLPGRLQPGLASRLVSDSFASGAVRIASTLLAFVTAVLLARLLGTEEYGSFLYALSWLTLFTSFALLGFDRLAIREVARFKSLAAWPALRGFVSWTNRVVLFSSVVLGVAAAAAAWLLQGALRIPDAQVVVFALVSLPLMTFMTLHQAVLQGLGQVVWAQVPQMLILPLAFIVLALGTYFLLDRALTARGAMLLRIGATVAALLFVFWLVQRYFPAAAAGSAAVYDRRAWLASALPFLLIAAAQVLNDRVSTLFLGSMRGAAEVSLFAVAGRGAELVLFPLIIVNAVIAPRIASLYVQGQIARLKRLLTISVRVVFFMALPVAAVMLVFGNAFLLIFGAEFQEGLAALRILTVGQLLNVAAGSVGLLLTMSGHERIVVRTLLLTTALAILGNALLIPLWGVEGAAWASAASVALWNLMLAYWSFRALGINTTILGRLAK